MIKALAAFGKRVKQDARGEKLANGWTELSDGTMIPPGWGYVGTSAPR